MANLIFALIASKRIVRGSSYTYEGVVTHTYAPAVPYNLGNMGLASQWKPDDVQHEVRVTISLNGDAQMDVKWVLPAAEREDGYVDHFQQLPTTHSFVETGRFEFAFFLDANPIHILLFEVFPLSARKTPFR